MNYSQAVNWIHSRLKFGIKPGLERMEWLMNQLGRPHTNILVVHIAGTNGKGSTLSFMRSILQEAGYSVGTFTSPYIETFNERISMNGIPVSDSEIAQLAAVMRPLVEKMEEELEESPTEFEVITAMAFYYFGSVNKPDVLLLETGLGGRLDSTNIAEPAVSVITNVGYDHMNILGDTISEIAAEKAGIIKKGIPVVTAAENREALTVIRQFAAKQQAPLYELGNHFSAAAKSRGEYGEIFDYAAPSLQLTSLMTNMKGRHQVKNAALAIAALEVLPLSLSEKEIREGIRQSSWSGRFEEIISTPKVIVDGAHNTEGINSLIDTVQRYYGDKIVHMIFSALKDKPYQEMISLLSEASDSITFTSFDFPRAETAENLFKAAKVQHKSFEEDWKKLLLQKMETMREDDVLIVTGSLYFISEVRNYCRKNFLEK
ncbi:bifunctional folylpolyglutamate synthase/dihydrofolate synthase [Metabacillus lacus]|nr:folylpolyglutamate synthase/dihydrofolate synthase family protein [Metabacillus lacus]